MNDPLPVGGEPPPLHDDDPGATEADGVIRPRRREYDIQQDGYAARIEDVLAQLDDVSQPDPTIRQWTALCPAHNDRSPSLSVSLSDRGCLLLHCHAGCSLAQVRRALNWPELNGYPVAEDVRRISTGRVGQEGPTEEAVSLATVLARIGGARLTTAPGSVRNWAAELAACRSTEVLTRLTEAATDLGVEHRDLETLRPGVELVEAGVECLVFPEYDDTGRVVGLMKRRTDGEKRAVKGSQRGIYIPTKFAELPGPIYCCEGPTDTAALVTMGLAVLGRPSARGGVDYLARFLSRVESDRPIIVLGERDEKPDGHWPGREAALEVARQLGVRLGRGIQVALPPSGAKDARAWLQHTRLASTAEKSSGKPPVISNFEYGRMFSEGLESLSPLPPTAAPAPFGILDTAAFLQANFELQWLVENVLVEGQLGVIGGPQKALKTSISVDLAVSLASRTPFLSKFKVPAVRRVLIMSSESGGATLKKTFHRVCGNKMIMEPEKLPIYWACQVPQFNESGDLEALRCFLEARRIEVVFIDPLYLCIAGAAEGAQVNNMFVMGKLLAAATQSCLGAGATPLLVHHTRKSGGHSGFAFSPLELDELAYSGLQQFVRQWLLISRRKPYDAERGVHELWLGYGGSAGHCGLWGLDVAEGLLGANFEGRQWDVTLATRSELEQHRRTAQQQQRESRSRDALEAALDEVISVLRRSDTPLTASDIKKRMTLGKSHLNAVLEQALQRRLVVEARLNKSAGRACREYDAYQLAEPTASDEVTALEATESESTGTSAI